MSATYLRIQGELLHRTCVPEPDEIIPIILTLCHVKPMVDRGKKEVSWPGNVCHVSEQSGLDDDHFVSALGEINLIQGTVEKSSAPYLSAN